VLARMAAGRVKASVVIATYNERENIGKLVKDVERVLSDSRIPGEIIIVDDNSPDGTGEIADRLAKRYSNVRVVHRKGKLGLGTAYIAGEKAAKGGVIITMDADLSHPPSAIPAMMRAIFNGADVVLGSRYVKGGEIRNWNAYRRAVSKGANTMARLMLGVKASDLTTGYRAYRRSALERLGFDRMRSTGYSFLMEVVCKAERKGLVVAEVPIVFTDRVGGKSKLGFKEQVGFARRVARLAISR